MKNFNTSNSSFIDYFLLFLLLATTGIPFFMYSIEYVIVGCALSSFVFYYRKRKIDQLMVAVVLVFAAVQILQGIIFNFFSFRTFFGLYVRLFFAYFVIKSIGNSFTLKYVVLLKYLAIISLFFYTAGILSTSFIYFVINNVGETIADPFLTVMKYESNLDIIIFNFHGMVESYWLILRNSGPFWEPGAFCGFLIIAIYFDYNRTKRLFNVFGIIAIITIVTTFSTTGYIAYATFALISLLLSDRYKNTTIIIKPILFMLTLLGVVYLFTTTFFLKEKIFDQMEQTRVQKTDVGYFVSSSNRFASALKDIFDVLDYPLTGLGRNEITRFKGADMDDRETVHRNNGITYLLATYGIVIFVMYFYLIYAGFRKLSSSKGYAYLGILLLFIIGFSEIYFTRVFFYALLFLSSIKFDVTIKQKDKINLGEINLSK